MIANSARPSRHTIVGRTLVVVNVLTFLIWVVAIIDRSEPWSMPHALVAFFLTFPPAALVATVVGLQVAAVILSVVNRKPGIRGWVRCLAACAGIIVSDAALIVLIDHIRFTPH